MVTQQTTQRGATQGEPERNRNAPAQSSDRQARRERTGNGQVGKLAVALGWFSIGLGVAEVAAPRRLSQLLGIRHRPLLLRALGVREIASGLGILSGRRPGGWLWSRVGGDVMDLALLGAALKSPKAKRGMIAAATTAVAGITVLDTVCSRQVSHQGSESGAIHVKKSIAINRSPEEIYRFWRDFQNLPRFMQHIESVQTSGDKQLHFVVNSPVGRKFEFDAEITEDIPNKLIAWRWLKDPDEGPLGSVRFERAPGGRGTMVNIELQYNPPGGTIGATIAKFLGMDPGGQAQESLRCLKQLMETGEIPTTEGQSAGRASSTSIKYDHILRGLVGGRM